MEGAGEISVQYLQPGREPSSFFLSEMGTLDGKETFRRANAETIKTLSHRSSSALAQNHMVRTLYISKHTGPGGGGAHL